MHFGLTLGHWFNTPFVFFSSKSDINYVSISSFFSASTKLLISYRLAAPFWLFPFLLRYSFDKRFPSWQTESFALFSCSNFADGSWPPRRASWRRYPNRSLLRISQDYRDTICTFTISRATKRHHCCPYPCWEPAQISCWWWSIDCRSSWQAIHSFLRHIAFLSDASRWAGYSTQAFSGSAEVSPRTAWWYFPSRRPASWFLLSIRCTFLILPPDLLGLFFLNRLAITLFWSWALYYSILFLACVSSDRKSAIFLSLSSIGWDI